MKILKEFHKKWMMTRVRFFLSLILLIILIHSGNLQGQSITNGIKRHAPSASQLKVQRIYTSQIGIREKQPNSGPAVEKYLSYVNLPKGNPWCAAFVCWVYGSAGVVNPRSGWSPALFGQSRVIWNRVESGKWKVESVHRVAFKPSPTSEFLLETSGKPPTSFTRPTRASGLGPQTSDIFGLYFPEKGRIAHVGFIDHWDGTWLTTVEGNTNVSGSREGDGVYKKRRLVRTVYKVARYIE